MISKALATNGATVYITSRSKDACIKAAEEITHNTPGTCIALDPVDLSKGEDAATTLYNSLTNMGVTKLDILVNNSGVAYGQTMEKVEDRHWDRVMNLNVKAMFFVTQKCYPLLKAAASPKSPARVINIGSVAGIVSTRIPSYVYEASKAAVHHLTIRMASSFAGDQILVNAIAPGLVPTDLGDDFIAYGGLKRIVKSIPLQRVGTENDMAGISLFLCSNASSWMTGVVLPIDGGHLVGKSML